MQLGFAGVLIGCLVSSVLKETVPSFVGSFLGHQIYPLSKESYEEEIAVDFIKPGDGFKISKEKYKNLSSIDKKARAVLVLLVNGLVAGLMTWATFRLLSPYMKNVPHLNYLITYISLGTGLLGAFTAFEFLKFMSNEVLD